MPELAIVGPGRVGWALFAAVRSVDGAWAVPMEPLGRKAPREPLADVDLVLLAVPDRDIGTVAVTVPAGPVVGHLSGATGLDALGDRRRGSMHPLITIPDPEIGSERLRDRCPFAVEGDPIIAALVDDLGGIPFTIDPANRGLYHAAAAVAANHVVTVLAQVERLAAQLGVDRVLFHRLTRAAIADVERTGAADALTGPASRGDWGTIERHLVALPPDERRLYMDVASAAARLAGHEKVPRLNE